MIVACLIGGMIITSGYITKLEIFRSGDKNKTDKPKIVKLPKIDFTHFAFPVVINHLSNSSNTDTKDTK